MLKIWITKHGWIPDGVYEYEIEDKDIISIRWDCKRFILIRSESTDYILKELDEVWCCAECGSTNVDEKRWINCNDDALDGGSAQVSDDEYHCNDCGESCEIITLKEYETK